MIHFVKENELIVFCECKICTTVKSVEWVNFETQMVEWKWIMAVWILPVSQSVSQNNCATFFYSFEMQNFKFKCKSKAKHSKLTTIFFH